MNLTVDSAFSGVVSIAKDYNTIFRAAYGCADKPNNVPNEPDTRFGTASAGKAFVATAVLRLIEQGRLTLGSRLGDLLDLDLRRIDPGVTVRQLLNHTSGIPDYFDESVMSEYEELWVDVPNYRIRQSTDVLPLFIDKPMMYPAGERFQYNNSGYVVLGLILEAVTGLPFDEHLKRAVFEPCGMASTGYYELDRLPAKCANSYIYDAGRGEYRTNIYSIDAKGTGAGGAFTTAPDVERFWHGLLTGRLLDPDTLALMLAPQAGGGCYGYGVWLIDADTPSFQGCDPGANFFTAYHRARGLSVTILSNIDYDVEALYGTLCAQLPASL